nr:unnamed protein product [Digitaria exilis]
MQPPPPPAPAAASTSSAPAPQSLVSRARTAIHSAAARVLTDIKADLRDADGSGGRSRAPSPTPRTSLDREADVGAMGREPDVKLPSPRDEVLETSPSGNVDCSTVPTETTSSANLTFPPASTVKQLVAAIE